MKRYIALFAAVILMATLTACGNNTAADTTEYHGEGQVQGGIKSDEEIENLQNEEQQSQNQEAEYVDNTGNEPDAYGTGNFQDYWEGDDYFDIEAYAKANGFVYVDWMDANANYVNNNKSAATQVSLEYTNGWRLFPGIGCIARDTKNSVDYCFYPISQERTYVSISKENTAKLSVDDLQLITIIIEAINANPDNGDPFANLGYDYIIKK